MKLKRITEGDFDPQTSVLRIVGTSPSGQRATVEITVENESTFITWMSGVMFEKKYEAGRGAALLADGITISAHERDGVPEISFQFRAGDLQTAFLFPLPGSTRAKSAEVVRAFQSALSMLAPDPSIPTRQ